jgi:threonylcarbamoyladenosine tRNA methylthiotransferase MtaB
MNLEYKIHTFGCKVNTYDSGLIEKNIKGSHHLQGTHDKRIHILNTCAVTAEATKEALRNIRRLKAKDPFCTVVVTGCAAQVDTASFESLPGADLVIANSHKSFIPEILAKYFKGEIKEKVFKSNIFRKEDLEAGGGVEKHHTRAFLKIQDGCNSFCTYCIIPYARGKSRSIPISNLTERVNDLYDSGVREVVLTGVHIGDYEDSKTRTLEDLIENLLLKTKMPRFRLTSLEPVELTPRLLDLYSEKRLCPHFHMSIQSANTEVLKQMKRKYTQREVIDSLSAIAHRLPKAFVGMDVIVGFPTETDQQFEDTYLTLKDLPWSRLHVFPYSERSGTKAQVMTESVPVKERGLRAQHLRALSLERYLSLAKNQIHSKKEVLVLGEVKNMPLVFKGLSHDYWPVQFSISTSQDSTNQDSVNLDSSKLKGSLVTVHVDSFKQPTSSMLDGYLETTLL